MDKNPLFIDDFPFWPFWPYLGGQNPLSHFLLDIGRDYTLFGVKSRENAISGIFRSRKSFLAILTPGARFLDFEEKSDF